MKPREVLLEADKTVADSGTHTMNIDVTEPITALYVNLRGTNGATSNKASPASHCITKIELVDGGETLWSMHGITQRGLIAHLMGVTPHSKISEIASDSQYDTVPIMFGRHWYDEEFGFNPNAFLNPQLKVTWNLAAVNAVGATGFVTGSGRLTAQLHLADGMAAPSKMLVNKEYEDFTSAASGDYVSELARDRVWRAMYVRAYEAGVALNSTLTNLKLDFDGGKYIPFDMSIPKIWRIMLSRFGNVFSEVLAQADNATAFENWMAFSEAGQISARSAGIIVGANNFDNSQTMPYIENDAGAAQTGEGVWCRIRGTSLENTVVFPFGHLEKPETWLNPSEYRNAKLYLTQGNAGANVKVGLQEVYEY